MRDFSKLKDPNEIHQKAARGKKKNKDLGENEAA